MPANSHNADDELSTVTGKAKRAANAAVSSAAEISQKAVNEAIDTAEKSLRDAAGRIEKAVREAVDAFNAGPYREQAAEQIDEAQKYFVERVSARPVTATFVGLGVGLLLGVLLSGRSSR
jgi:ElaB/YqjD/DUF883 family membrane-anchored ribosome-binding protein